MKGGLNRVNRQPSNGLKNVTVNRLACSQTLYFLFKIRRARVMKYKSQGIYCTLASLAEVFEKNEQENKTTFVYRLLTVKNAG